MTRSYCAQLLEARQSWRRNLSKPTYSPAIKAVFRSALATAAHIKPAYLAPLP